MDNLSDEQLMTGILAGDTTSLTVLVERHYGSLLGYLYRLLGGNRPLAEDITQDTFLHVLQQGSYRRGRAFKPWFYAIATNLVRDHYKSAEIKRSSPQDDQSMLSIFDTDPNPEEAVLASEQESIIAAAIMNLGEEYRAALLLRFYHGLSLQEIAETLNIPLGTVKSRLSIGTHRLRALLSTLKEEGVRS